MYELLEPEYISERYEILEPEYTSLRYATAEEKVHAMGAAEAMKQDKEQNVPFIIRRV